MAQSAVTLHRGKAAEVGPTSTAVVLRLGEATIQQFNKASQANDGLLFIGGASPKLRIGTHSIPLTLSESAFRTELYASTASSRAGLTFTTLVSHRATEQKSDAVTQGTDYALAELQNNLASFAQEKLANQAKITNSILPTSNGRAQKGKAERSILGAGGRASSPALSAVSTPTLAPSLNDRMARLQAMRVPVVHLLAMKSCSEAHISEKTHIPKDDLDKILPKLAKQVDGKWVLTDRAYRELDVHSFKYTSAADRKAAVENAIRAFDRLRLPKEERVWQMLLPLAERDKGVVLSRLQVKRDLTPRLSPMPHDTDADDHKLSSSTVGTPLVKASTPRLNAKSGIMERMTNPKKRAVEEAKVKKRKEREAAASDRETAKGAKGQKVAADSNGDGAKVAKRQKVKSDELVRSSDDESGEVSDAPAKGLLRKDSKLAVVDTAKCSRTATPKGTSDVPGERKQDPPARVKDAGMVKTKPKPTDFPAVGNGKSTPQAQSSKALSAPDSRHKSQLSPNKLDSKPHIPSPLGAARPRVASDVSDRNAVGVQRRPDTPKGLGITRKREGTVTSTASSASSTEEAPRTAPPNGVTSAKPKVATPNGTASTKRPAPETMAPQPKHRKTTPSPNLNGSSSSNSDTSVGILDAITFSSGVQIAQKFQDVFYPAYARLYDEQAAREARGEVVGVEEREKLLAMHRRLAQMKGEIAVAGRREGDT